MNSNMMNYYALRAAEYDRIYAKPERQSDLEILKRELSTQFQNRDVLEIACGTGYWTQFIARSARAITATDYNNEMLEMAQQKDYGTCLVRFQRADAYYLPVWPAPYSGAFAGFWWSHVPRASRTELIRSLHAGLAKNALTVWIDNRYVEGSSTPIVRWDAAGNSYQIRLLSDGSQHEVIKNYPSENELKNDFAPYADKPEVRLYQYFWLLRYQVKKP